MTHAKTLLQLSGADLAPCKISDSCLILIDLQNEYLDGPVAVSQATTAIEAARTLLKAARADHAPVFHIAHKGRPGGLFDRDADRGQIVTELSPQSGEPVIEKQLPNAFFDTGLKALIDDSGRKNLVICGFMTHLCVSSTARAGIEFGYRITIAAPACATRDLPDGQGTVLPAKIVHNVTLAALSDRFAVIANRCEDLV